jgi:protein-disulfide isomerase
MSRLHAPALALIALALAGCAAAPKGASGPPQPPQQAAAPPAAKTEAQAFNDLGHADAPVTIIEFSDYECPYCARYALQTFPELRRNYIDTGKIRYASRDLPLKFHRFAIPAAVAARCAGEQGRYWEYRHALFSEQSRLGAALYAELAQAQGLDMTRFESCRTDGRAAAAVRADAELAQSQGITSTPTFVVGRVVDGQFQAETIEGAKQYAVFAARLDALLAGGK